MTDTPYTLRRTGERRAERASFKVELHSDPRPPEHISRAPFQEHYILEGRVRITFWANKAQLPGAQKAAERELRHFLYRDFLTDLYAMETAIEEMDQDELRRIYMSMRDTVRGTND